MLSQNSLANTYSSSSSLIANTLFDLGDCFGNLCRIPLESALRLFHSDTPEQQTSDLQPHTLANQLHTSIPFAVSREWQNQVWNYRVSLHTDNQSQSLHRHLATKTLRSIPEADKADLKTWLYFASPLEHLLKLNWELLSAEQLKLQRLNHLRYWLINTLEQSSHVEGLLLQPLNDLPLGDGLSQHLAQSFARVGKQSLPNQTRLESLHFAVIRQGALSEGYGLAPNALFSVRQQLAAGSQPEDQPILVLDRKQCERLLDLINQGLTA